MKKMKLLILISASLFLTNCKNNSTTSNNIEIKTSSIEEKRVNYLQKKEWLSPEDMELFSKCIIPYKERGLMDEEQRKETIISCLRNSNISEIKIKSIVKEIEKIHGGRTGQWNYEYILARFANYKNEMSTDSEWNKIENEYSKKVKENKTSK